MSEPDASVSQFSLRTVWGRRLETPLRRFLRTETGSAAVLLAATLAALAWANIDPSGVCGDVAHRAGDPVRHTGTGR